MIKITEEMQQRVDKAFEEKKYCVWATTSDDGFPDMSFRGSTFVFDDEHLAFRDRSFGASTTNLESGPPVCMLFDKENRWGWRFHGKATIHKDVDLANRSCAARSNANSTKTPSAKATASSCASTRFAATAASTWCRSASRLLGRDLK